MMTQRSIEAFLEDAFGSLKPTSSVVGHVEVEPILIPDEGERAELTKQLVRCIEEQTAKRINLTPQGYDIALSDNYPLLKKYLRAVTLKSD